jgi:hypothetical protein
MVTGLFLNSLFSLLPLTLLLSIPIHHLVHPIPIRNTVARSRFVPKRVT